MRCPKCGELDTRVIDSRMQEATNATKRRRECRSCGYRFTTFERCEDLIEVVKATAQPSHLTVISCLSDLCALRPKRKIELSQLNAVIDDIESELRASSRTAVSSHDIGDMVLKRLQNIDKVAYIRFASVYRDFKDVDEFVQELEKLR